MRYVLGGERPRARSGKPLAMGSSITLEAAEINVAVTAPGALYALALAHLKVPFRLLFYYSF